MLTQPGRYALPLGVQGLTPAERWRTYIMLTDVEAVFRSPKPTLGLRPVVHHKRPLLFITVLAYPGALTVGA